VEQFLNRWLTDCAQQRLRPRTFISYSQVVRLHVVATLGRVPLQRLTPQHVQAWLNERHRAGLSPRTCQYMRAILRSALAQAHRRGIVARNVATLVESPRVTRHEITPLNPEQGRALLAAVRDHRLGALFTAAVALGLRQGEALGLKWDAVNLDSGMLTVRAALQRVGKRWELVDPKSERSRRTLVMPEVVSTALRAHRVRQLEERLLAGSRWHETGFVFTTRTGDPIDACNLMKAFRPC